jgi:hypothetical protein
MFKATLATLLLAVGIAAVAAASPAPEADRQTAGAVGGGVTNPWKSPYKIA